MQTTAVCACLASCLPFDSFLFEVVFEQLAKGIVLDQSRRNTKWNHGTTHEYGIHLRLLISGTKSV